jgi:RNA 2',3'-cyclic 3'-phosphodiesterase
VRAFVAFYPDEFARGELVEVAPDDADTVRVTDMADWHVTIRFLGQLDESRVEDVASTAAGAIAGVPSFTARLGPLTALGTGARVLFVPVVGAEALALAVDEALEGLVEPRDGPYRGHLTLARARGRGRLPGGLSGLPVSVRFAVTEAALVASSLEPDRAVHRVVATFPLGDA